ncbi:MAG TPA: HNH endonuclease [Acetobacteraceae bacterium]
MADKWKAANRAKVNAAEREARLRDPDRYKAHVAKYLATDKAKETRHAYYLAHADEIKRRARKRAEQNPERTLEASRRHYSANKERIKQRTIQWNAANPEGQRTRRRNYRARLNGADGSHTTEDIQRIGDAQNWKCHWCGKSTKRNYHVDHVVPLSRGGSNEPGNLVIACPRCNNHKRATDPIEFARRLGLLI